MKRSVGCCGCGMVDEVDQNASLLFGKRGSHFVRRATWSIHDLVCARRGLLLGVGLGIM